MARKRRGPRCPIPRDVFFASATPIVLSIAAFPRLFSTGSFGWHLSERRHVEMGGIKIPVQVTCTVTVVGSKDAQ